ncbi:MAG: leucine-rich repeat protein [Roseburia faecis]
MRPCRYRSEERHQRNRYDSCRGTIDGVTYKVTSIADNAFKNNKKITKVVIGNNIVSIGKTVFSGCKNLKTITIKAKNLTSKSIKKGAFGGISKETVIKVPKSKYKAYKKLFRAKGCVRM